MTKRLIALFALWLFLIVFSAGAVLAQAPFVSILSPGSGVVDTTTPLPVIVQFGNAPEGGAGLVVKAFDDTETNLFGQSATNDVSSIPWNTTIVFGPVPADGTTGHLIAYMLDSGGTVIATSPIIPVTYGNPPAPPPTPTNPPLPASITVTTPVNGANVDPSTNIIVAGSTANSPNDVTILVRLRNANGETLGEQGFVPTANQPWSTTVTKTIPAVATTGNGTIFAFLLENGNVIAQTNAIPVNFPGAPPPNPSITLNSPANGATVSNSSVIPASGTVSNVPGVATVLVQAFVNGSANPVGQQTVSPNGGTWAANITLTTAVSGGSQGHLIAYALSNSNVVATSNTVSVFYGSANNAIVQITSPTNGAIVGVNSSPIPITGTAINVFENTVTVRALDTLGNVLAQTTATNFPSTNTWQTQFFVNVAPGTPGTLFAFATNPQTGTVAASAHVNVNFGGPCFVRTDLPIYVVQARDTLLKIAQKVGATVSDLAVQNCLPNANLVFVGQQLHVPNPPVTPQPAQPTLRIISPVENAQLDTTQRILISGAGANLIGNNIVVRALDANGNLLAQQTTIPGTLGGSGESAWQVSLSVLTPNGTRGTIYAFAQSPANNAVLADALVDVTFGPSASVPSQSAQQLIITQPTANTSITPSGQLQVSGQVMAPIDGDVFVRILDNQGNVLAEVQADVAQADAQGNMTWQALVNINVPPGTRGTIFAYVPSPFDLAGAISDSVNVVFGQPDNGPYVTITSPMPYATLDTTTPITISGRGGRLFEGGLVVRALDAQGNVLAESPTTINAPNAGTGGEGDWQASLQVNAPAGTRGSIVAFSTSGQNGGVVAFASLYVTFGDPTHTANFVHINAPLPGTIVDPSQTLMIAGIADRSNGNTVRVQIVDDQGHVLVEQPRNLNPTESGNFGIWQLLVELKSLPAGTHLRINALTISHINGSTLATDSVDIIVGPSSQGS